ncbi:MAG: hypothetical protein WCD18_18185, partial [Thermosynechococcaceae cyanobacterium]
MFNKTPLKKTQTCGIAPLQRAQLSTMNNKPPSFFQSFTRTFAFIALVAVLVLSSANSALAARSG